MKINIVTGLSWLGILIFVILIGCSKKDSDNQQNNAFDQGALLANISDNIIMPAYENLALASNDLKDAIATFTEAPDEDKLQSVQAKFKAAYKAWVHCEPFNFGPADETVMLQNAINYWPTKPSLINTELAGSGEISASYVEGIGAEKKGFPALAYLFFNIKDGNTAVLNTFTAEGSERRKEYVNALAENIAANVTTIRDAWKNGYAATFKTNTGTSLNSSLSLLLNNLVIDLETSKNKRIGVPIGRKDNFTQGPVDPDAVELPYTDFARDMLRENADVMDNLFRGNSGVGFDDYVAVLKVQNGSTTLEESIKTEFSTFKDEIDAINSPMQNTISTDPSSINTAWVQSKKLLVLLKVDLASNLGILITFSDNDGD